MLFRFTRINQKSGCYLPDIEADSLQDALDKLKITRDEVQIKYRTQIYPDKNSKSGSGSSGGGWAKYND